VGDRFLLRQTVPEPALSLMHLQRSAGTHPYMNVTGDLAHPQPNPLLDRGRSIVIGPLLSSDLHEFTSNDHHLAAMPLADVPW